MSRKISSSGEQKPDQGKTQAYKLQPTFFPPSLSRFSVCNVTPLLPLWSVRTCEISPRLWTHLVFLFCFVFPGVKIWTCCWLWVKRNSVFALWIEDRSHRWCHLLLKRQLSDVHEGTAAPATGHKAAICRTFSDPYSREWTGRHPTWSDVGQLVLTPTSAGAFIVKRLWTCDPNLTMTLSFFFFSEDAALTWL